MARRKPTATQKLRSNVKRTLRSLEKRGYIIPEKVREEINRGKYQTLKSYQKGGYRKLYENIQGEINGEKVSGRRMRNWEREQAAQKGARTKRAKTRGFDEYGDGAGEIPNVGEVIYYQLLNLIAENPGAGGNHLKLILDEQVNEYGLEAVIRSLGEAPEEAIEAAQKVVHYREYTEEEVADATNALVRILSGEKPSMSDLIDDYEGIFDFDGL